MTRSKILKILMALSLIVALSGNIYAQDDDGGGGGDVGGDVGGDIGGDAGGVVDSDIGADTVEYTEEQVIEGSDLTVPSESSVSTTTVTSTTHGYGPRYVYDPTSVAIVSGLAAGSAAGAAVGSATASASKSNASVQKVSKGPIVIKKRPPENINTQAAAAESKKQ